MVHRTLLPLIVTGALLLTSGCATFFKSQYEPVTVTSNLRGTRVHVDGAYMGVTPLILKLSTQKQHVISFSRRDVQTRHFVLGNRISTEWLIIDLMLGPHFLIIDALTGAWLSLNTNIIHMDMRRYYRGAQHPCPGKQSCDAY